MIIRYVVSFVWCMVFCVQSATAMDAVEKQDVLNALLPRVQRVCVAPQYEKVVAELAEFGFVFNKDVTLEFLAHALMDDVPGSTQKFVDAGLALHRPWAYSTPVESDASDESTGPLDAKKKSWLETLVACGNPAACMQKINGLVEGNYGYAADPAAARALIEEHVARGAVWALLYKVRVLADPAHKRISVPVSKTQHSGVEPNFGVYAQDKGAARAIIDHYAAQGEEWAIREKIHGLCGDPVGAKRLGVSWIDYGYEKNVEEARALLERYVACGKEWALQDKVVGLAFGWYGYEQNKDAARALIEEYVVQDCEWAVRQKYYALKPHHAHYGYEKNVVEAEALLKKYEDSGAGWAVVGKINKLVFQSFEDFLAEIRHAPHEEKILNFLKRLAPDVKRVHACAYGLLHMPQ